MVSFFEDVANFLVQVDEKFNIFDAYVMNAVWLSFAVIKDYWLDTNLLQHPGDKLHTIFPPEP